MGNHLKNKIRIALSLAVLTVFSIASETHPQAGSSTEGSGTKSKTKAPIVDDGRYDYGLSQPVYKKIIAEQKVKIPLPDGTILRGDIYRPDAPGRFPVIIAEAPYPRYNKIHPGVTEEDRLG